MRGRSLAKRWAPTSPSGPLLVVIAIISGTNAADVIADGNSVPRSVSVTGEGSVSAAPDMAVFEAGVVTEAATAAEALKSNNVAAAEILALLKQLRIADKDVQTVQIDIRPRYAAHRSRAGQESPAQIIGYSAVNRIQVKVRNLPQLGGVLDAVVQKGGNQISGIRFDIDDKSGILDQARNRAMRDAQRRAELYAHAAGVSLGDVLVIREAGATVPPAVRMGRAMMAAESVPISSGEQELSVSIQVTYQLEAK